MIFKWLERIFSVSDTEILTYNGLSASHSFNTEEKKNGKNMPKTKEVSPGIGTLNFSVRLSALQGNDVKGEHDWWVEECEKGTYSYIYMGKDKFGKYKWRIKQVDVSDLITTDDGSIWRSCTLSVSFEEYYVKVRLSKAEKKAAKLQKKMRRAMEKAENAKNDKARDKALDKAEDLAKDFVKASVEAAKIKAAESDKVAKVTETIEKILYPERNNADQKAS